MAYSNHLANDPAEVLATAKRLTTAIQMRDKIFFRETYGASEMIVSLRPNASGHLVSEPYTGQPFDPKCSRVVAGGGDHDHCYICMKRVVPGDEWWAAAPPDQVGLCLDCHGLVLLVRQDPRAVREGELEEEARLRKRDRSVTMTESEWRVSVTPRAMLMSLEDRANARKIDRELRLFACACVFRVWHLLVDVRSRDAVFVAERYADGLAGPDELDAAGDEADAAAGELYVSGGLAAADEAKTRDDWTRDPSGAVFGESDAHRAWSAASAASRLTARKVGSRRTNEVVEGGAWVAAVSVPHGTSDAIASVEVLRAREAPLDAAYAALEAPLSTSDPLEGVAELRARDAASTEAEEARRLYDEPWQADLLRCLFGNPFRAAVADPSWLTPDVVHLARTIYDRRTFELMRDLADALEAAGCRDDALLAHCRESFGHGRGCWVIDVVLGNR